MDDLATARTNAETATSDVAKLQETIPGLLQGLRQNLTSIYQKDNPLVQARDTQLADYLSAPDLARAEYLPGNQPVIGGSNLNFSPTQLNAMVSQRQNAALAPLLGTNQALLAGYGNIGDIVTRAGNIYQSQVDAAKTRQTGAQNLYQIAADLEKQRISSANSNAGTGDLASIIAALLAGQNQGGETEDEWEIISENQPSSSTSQPLGEISLYPGGPTVPSVPGKQGTGLNLGNIPMNWGNSQPGTGLYIAGGNQNPFAGLGPFNLTL